MNNSLESRCEHALIQSVVVYNALSFLAWPSAVVYLQDKELSLHFTIFFFRLSAIFTQQHQNIPSISATLPSPEKGGHSRLPPNASQISSPLHSRKQCPLPSPQSIIGTSTIARANPQATVPAQHTSSCISTRNSTFSPMSTPRSTSVPLLGVGARFWGKS